MKLLWLLVLAVLACRLVLGRWPWQLLARGSARGAALARARRLLGVAPGAGRGEIIEAHRRLISTVHPDRGGRNEDAHAANEARDMLLDNLPRESQEHT